MKQWIANVIVVLTLLGCAYFFVTNGKESYTFYGDAEGYYSYLPSAFIYHNFHAIDSLPSDKGIEYPIMHDMEHLGKNAPRSPKGHIINQYTYGVAFLEMPFFFMAHSYEAWHHLPMNGYSTNYHYAIKLGTFFYLVCGIWFLYGFLRRRWDGATSAIVCSLIVIGTNVMWFGFFQSGMAHIPIFFLYAAFLWNMDLLLETASWKRFIVAGLLGGMITLIRPSDILLLSVPLFIQLTSWKDVKHRFNFFRQHVVKLMLAGMMFIVPMLPQFIYWKKYAGSFMYYSYNDQGFAWKPEHIYEGLFGFNNGWLAYSPMMILSVIGLFFIRKSKPFFLSVLLVFVPYVLLIYSWWCYTYINGFGSRPMIHIYPLLALPMAVVIEWILDKKWRLAFLPIIAFLVWVSFSMSMHQGYGNLHSEESNRIYNQSLLFKSTVNFEDLLMLELGIHQPDERNLQLEKYLGVMNMEDSLQPPFLLDTTGHGGRVMEIQSDREYYPSFSVLLNDQVAFHKRWVKCSGDFYVFGQGDNYFTNSLLVVDIHRGDEVKLWNKVHIHNKIGYKDSIGEAFNHAKPAKGISNRWGQISFFVRLPEDSHAGDKLSLSIWNLGWAHILVDNLKLELWREKE